MATPYITTAVLIAKFGDKIYEILNVAVGADISANAIALSAIEEANDYADSILRQRYAVEDFEAPYPPALVGEAAHLAFWNILSKTRQESMNESDIDNRRNAVNYFDRVSKGIIALEFPKPHRTESAKTMTKTGIGSTNATNRTSRLASDQDWFGSI